MSGALRELMWNNRDKGKERKTHIYKTCVRLILTCNIGARVDTREVVKYDVIGWEEAKGENKQTTWTE